MIKVLLTSIIASFLTLAMVNGCVEHDEYPPGDGYAARGYYYDPDYYDSYGVYHPRAYWFYDGHSYAHRDALPHGEMAALRANVAHGGSHHEDAHGGAAPHGDAGHGGSRDDHGAY